MSLTNFGEADRERFLALEIPAARGQGKVVLVDGKIFGWYGAKSLEALGRTRGARRRGCVNNADRQVFPIGFFAFAWHGRRVG